MIVDNLFIFLLINIIHADVIHKNKSDSVFLHWMTSNFGSSFASQPCLYDVDHDGFLDMVSVSFDGEVAVYNLKNGEALIDSNWPIYLNNDHFYAKPVMYIHGENINKELITITSHKGRIYYLEWKGMLVKTEKINNIYLRRNWTFVPYKELSEIILTERKGDEANMYYELYPEVFADVNLLDLSIDGVMNDLIIPVSFVTEQLGSDNVIVAAIVVFNLQSGLVTDIHPLSVSKKDGEYPGYLLSNIQIVHGTNYRIVITSTSGIIYQLQWNRVIRKFQALFNGAVTYNQGPHSCQLTWYCSDRNGTFMDNYMCCLYVDFYGHGAMIDLLKHRPIWEYKSLRAATPTVSEIFVDNRHQSPWAIFADNKGWIHCISLLTGSSKESFPLHIADDTFDSSPVVVADAYNQLIVLLISDKGHLYMIPLDSPGQYKSLFHIDQIDSYLPPLILPSAPNSLSIDIIVHSKKGFITRFQIPNFKKRYESLARVAINNVNPTAIGTLYGLGSSFSFVLMITDVKSQIVKSSPFYIIKVFINEYLYYTHKALHSGQRDTEVTVLIDLTHVNRTLIPPSVFLFGTATVLVSDASGATFPPDYINIRLNYDFQFELVWIVYLTFFVCCSAILLFHCYDYNDKLYIPVHISRDS